MATINTAALASELRRLADGLQASDGSVEQAAARLSTDKPDDAPPGINLPALAAQMQEQLADCVRVLGECRAREIEAREAPRRFEHGTVTGPTGKPARPIDRASADVLIEGDAATQLAAIERALSDLDRDQGMPCKAKVERQPDDDAAIAERIFRLRATS